MKEYKFIQMTLKMFKGYCSDEQYGKTNHREVIRRMAQEGWSFVGQLPISVEGYGRVTSYDLVFEKEE